MNTPLRAREAALFVHGLPEDARSQVLARLDSDERAQIEPLLVELVALGIPRLPHPQLIGSSKARVEQSPVERAQRLSGAEVSAALADANAATLALLLRVSDWPWRGDLLASLDRTRREQALAWSRRDITDAVAPAVADALCFRLLERAARIASKQPASPVTRSPRKRWFPWTR